MRFNIGDRVRHRGLRWLSGTVEEIYEALRAHSDESRYYLYKVSLERGNYYIDRGCEWELIPGQGGRLDGVSALEAEFGGSVSPEVD